MSQEPTTIMVFRSSGSELAMRVRKLNSTEKDYVWIPRSQVTHAYLIERGAMCGPDKVQITCPLWLLEKRGLV